MTQAILIFVYNFQCIINILRKIILSVKHCLSLIYVYKEKIYLLLLKHVENGFQKTTCTKYVFNNNNKI